VGIGLGTWFFYRENYIIQIIDGLGKKSSPRLAPG
jgi:hypothetical protein